MARPSHFAAVSRVYAGHDRARLTELYRCVSIWPLRMIVAPQVSSSSLTQLPVLDCTPLPAGAALDEPAAVRLAGLLRVLADPARLRILSLLQAQPSHEACVCHVTDFLALGRRR